MSTEKLFWKPGSVAPGEAPQKQHALDTQEVEDDISAAALLTAAQGALIERKLPVLAHREEFLYLVEHHQVVVVVGQTGSGKTTQLPQYLYQAGWTSEDQMVACTQPRRMAAVSVATRVAEEMGTRVGERVGYAVRFEERSTAKVTRIKYLTDGMLFREALFDPLLARYSVIMVDEAHERTLYTDLLLGLLKKILQRRPKLRIIVSSATLDAQAFISYFSNISSPVAISLQGRCFPVSIYYLGERPVDVVEEAVATALKIHMSQPPGDVLVFLAGRDEIERAEAILRERTDALVSSHRQRIWPLGLHAGLPLEQQLRVFEQTPRGSRKVVLATNIAETSLTIEGIIYVIDGGKVKQRVYNASTGLDHLLLTDISQASAQQRAGRAGRLGPGHVYRLYTEQYYLHTLPPTTLPDIQKCGLATVVLQLKALGIDRILNFDFMAAPSVDILARTLELLYALGALDLDGRLTTGIGEVMAQLPVDPLLARILLASKELGCGAEAVSIVAMLCAQPIFLTPSSAARQAFDDAKRRVSVEEGDLISLLNVLRSFEHQGGTARWCQRHFLNYKALCKAVRVRKLLARYMERYGLEPDRSAGDQILPVLKCIVAGLFANAAQAQADGSYRSLQGQATLHIHPTSALFHRVPSYLVFYEVVETNKAYMRGVTAVEAEWLAEMAPRFYEMHRHQRMAPSS